MEAIAAPGQYAPAAYPGTVEPPYLALRPILDPGDEPGPAVLLLEIDLVGVG